MLDYQNTLSTLHTIGLRITEDEYLFVMQVALGENPSVAYAIVYDRENISREIETEDFEDYLLSVRPLANAMLEKQEIAQARDTIEEMYRADIQRKATNIKEYKFSSQEIVNMLSALLAERSSQIEEASVRDIVALIRELNAQGGLSGSDGFEKHFIQIYPPFNALCVKCMREFDCYAGLDGKCPHCGQVYRWSESENRFYPQFDKL